MAEYVEVMKQKKRMCKRYTGGGICQSIGYKICPLKGHDLCCKPLTNMDIDKIQEGEAIIMKWAAENPELVYPSWIDWLRQIDVVPPEQKCFHAWLLEPIPADIAQKLGIEPKGES